MTDDQSAAATKEDIRLLMEQIGGFIMKTDDKLEEMRDEIRASEERMKAHFDLVAETIKFDFQHGAIPDKIAQHEDRLVRVEQHLGLAA
jgi:hypothetical protein